MVSLFRLWGEHVRRVVSYVSKGARHLGYLSRAGEWLEAG